VVAPVEVQVQQLAERTVPPNSWRRQEILEVPTQVAAVVEVEMQVQVLLQVLADQVL
jgi:hypothetical protein